MRIAAVLIVAVPLCLVGMLAADEPSKDNQITLPLFLGPGLSGWDVRDSKLKDKSKWEMVGGVRLKEGMPEAFETEQGQGVLVNTGNGVDLVSQEAIVGDCELKIDFNIPKGSNSGIYFCGRYELQIADSSGKADKDLTYHDCGGIYDTAAPKTNACEAPGKWQTYEVVFQAPKFDKKFKKTQNAKFVKVTLNGKVIHENVEVKGPTQGGLTEPPEMPAGPFVIQGDHGPVAFRNGKLTVPFMRANATAR